MKRVTMSDVANEANVSKSTVSQYINKRYDYMGEDTKTRIEQAIRQLGYQPNYVARSLKQKKTSTIGVIVANILHSFSTQLIRAIEDFCHEHDFHVIVCNADDDPVKEKKYIDMLRAKQVDGLIVVPTGRNITLYEQMVDETFPLVFVDRVVEGLPVHTLMLDNEKASSLAVEHLIASGYEDIGIITASIVNHLPPRVERINGYKQALLKHGIDVNQSYIKSAEPVYIQSSLKDMLSLSKPPKALVLANDLVLMETLAYIKEENLTIPDDLAIVGIDDVSFASLFNPALTTVAQPAFEMGKKAACILLQLISQSDETEQEYILRFEPTLKHRQST
ncbi:substrate-binding domain-containing protein [Caldalkalibacillus salinus]|uniref:substrate-binding domain-containing protein n=1 Tax=Caldalkalibacillus salinus TaxID=2803787 RepID=UPI0019243A0A|nr:substrate-binding domain-containing protein [Caldalkalibacillus salinus]